MASFALTIVTFLSLTSCCFGHKFEVTVSTSSHQFIPCYATFTLTTEADLVSLMGDVNETITLNHTPVWVIPGSNHRFEVEATYPIFLWTDVYFSWSLWQDDTMKKPLYFHGIHARQMSIEGSKLFCTNKTAPIVNDAVTHFKPC